MLSASQTPPIAVPRPAPRPRALRFVVEVVGVALVAAYLVRFARHNVSLQWDLRSYLVAARAALAGFDPYDVARLTRMAGRPTQPFIYPPIALAPFLALSALPPATAAAAWMIAKLALLAGLAAMWRRWLPDRSAFFSLALVVVFGWSAAALADLRTGNVALVECTLLWAGFACFVAGRRTAFAALVVFAACFKLMPAAFLLLLLVPGPGATRRLAPFLAAVAALAVLVCVPLAFAPVGHWGNFLVRVPVANTLGPANPSALGLIIVLAEDYGMDPAVAAAVGAIGWLTLVVAVVALSIPFFRDAWRRADPRRWVVGAVFLYVLLSPRPMAYGFLLLGPAPLFLAPPLFRSRVGQWLLALLLSVQGLTVAMGVMSDSLAAMYSPVLLALCLWLLILGSPRAQESSVSQSLPDTRSPREQAA